MGQGRDRVSAEQSRGPRVTVVPEACCCHSAPRLGCAFPVLGGVEGSLEGGEGREKLENERGKNGWVVPWQLRWDNGAPDSSRVRRGVI